MTASIKLPIVKFEPKRELKKILYTVLIVGGSIILFLFIPASYVSNLVIGFFGLFLVCGIMIFNFSYHAYMKMGFVLLGDEKILVNWDSEEQTIDLDTVESIKIHYSSTAGDYHLLAPLTGSLFTEDGTNNVIVIKTIYDRYEYNVLIEENNAQLYLKNYIDNLILSEPKIKAKYEEDVI
jgi:hypothetical protein